MKEESDPGPGPIVSELLSIIPESEKADDYNYEDLKLKALESKFE